MERGKRQGEEARRGRMGKKGPGSSEFGVLSDVYFLLVECTRTADGHPTIPDLGRFNKYGPVE